MKNGRRTSKHNAITHGILADILLVGDHLGESSQTYRQMLSALRASMRPTDDYEDLLIEKLAFLYIRLTRVYKADWQLAPKLFKRLQESVEAEHNLVTSMAMGFGDEVVGQRKDPAPELLVRYESNIERQISRTLDQLQQWRMIRPNNPEALAQLEEQVESHEVKDIVSSSSG